MLATAPNAPWLVDLVCPSGVAGLDVVASSCYLSGVERAMAREPVGAEAVLWTALAGLPAGRWEVVLLDCPPALGLLSTSALVAVGDVLVPVETQVMALDGLAALLDSLAKIRATLNPRLRLATILPCRVDRTRLAREVIGALRDRLGKDVLTTQIRQSGRLAETPSHRRPILSYAPAATRRRPPGRRTTAHWSPSCILVCWKEPSHEALRADSQPAGRTPTASEPSGGRHTTGGTPPG